jgi:hypothetical protein
MCSASRRKRQIGSSPAQVKVNRRFAAGSDQVEQAGISAVAESKTGTADSDHAGQNGPS